MTPYKKFTRGESSTHDIMDVIENERNCPGGAE